MTAPTPSADDNIQPAGDNRTMRRMLLAAAKRARIEVPRGASNAEIQQLIAPKQRLRHQILREGGRSS